MVEQYIDYQVTEAAALTFGYWKETREQVDYDYFWAFIEIEMARSELPVNDGYAQLQLMLTCPTTGYVSSFTCMMYGVDAQSEEPRIEKSWVVSESRTEDTFSHAIPAEFNSRPSDTDAQWYHDIEEGDEALAWIDDDYLHMGCSSGRLMEASNERDFGLKVGETYEYVIITSGFTLDEVEFDTKKDSGVITLTRFDRDPDSYEEWWERQMEDSDSDSDDEHHHDGDRGDREKSDSETSDSEHEDDRMRHGETDSETSDDERERRDRSDSDSETSDGTSSDSESESDSDRERRDRSGWSDKSDRSDRSGRSDSDSDRSGRSHSDSDRRGRSHSDSDRSRRSHSDSESDWEKDKSDWDDYDWEGEIDNWFDDWFDMDWDDDGKTRQKHDDDWDDWGWFTGSSASFMAMSAITVGTTLSILAI